MQNSKKTLDTHHNHYITELRKSSEDINKLELKVKTLDARISKFEERDKPNNPSTASFNSYISSIDERLELKKKITELKKQFDETSYLTGTSDILFKYYDLVEKGNNVANLNNQNQNDKANVGIMKFFSGLPSVTTDSNRCSNGGANVTNDRGALLDKYMYVVDSDYITKPCDIETPTCSHCKSTKIIIMSNDGYTYCSECNCMEKMIIDHDKPSYKDPPKEITYFSYKRINHLTEWLNQIQGKETTEIPDEIYDKILFEVKKQRIENMADLTCEKMKTILKQLKIHKYYEHIPHIINRLNGKQMPNFTPELEEKLRTMFKHIQTPFLKHSPKNRKNFLSYSYVIHKSLQLLEKDEYLSYFPLLRSREKLAVQDSIWKKICGDVGWQYIPSL